MSVKNYKPPCRLSNIKIGNIVIFVFMVIIIASFVMNVYLMTEVSRLNRRVRNFDDQIKNIEVRLFGENHRLS